MQTDMREYLQELDVKPRMFNHNELHNGWHMNAQTVRSHVCRSCREIRINTQPRERIVSL
jgi:hypothetical protein